jgi:hypothetical protein
VLARTTKSLVAVPSGTGRHRLHEPQPAVDRASDEEIVALLAGRRELITRINTEA